MTEILTESFCERCGTRYTFESDAPRQKRMGGLKVLGRGFKNFVMSDDSSLDEAFAAARSDAERDATAHQLDAFHKTFNFCMSCRQYTCANCWNEPEARCLSCAPVAVDESVPVYEPDVDPERLLRFMGGATAEAPGTNDEPVAAEHVHTSELIGDEVHEAHVRAEAAEAEAAAVDAADAEAAAVAAAEAEADAVAGRAAEALAADAARAAELEAEAAEAGRVADETELPPARQRAATINGFEPGQNLDDAIAAYEASLANDAFAAAGEPAAVAEALDTSAAQEMPAEAEAAPAVGSEEPELVAEPEPVAAAEPEPEPSPVEIEVEPEPVAADAAAAAADEPPARPAGVDVIDQPVWPAAAQPGTEGPAAQPTPPTTPGESPAWPTGPRWPTAIPARQAPPLPSPAVDPLTALMARSSTDAMWAASNRDVLQPIASAQSAAAVQPCSKCGISLSATARFCRRCGTPQG